MNIEELFEAGAEILKIIGDYTTVPHREMLIDPILFGYFRGAFENVERQHHVNVYGSTKPKRIDFRQGGHNPSVLELAVRPPTGEKCSDRKLRQSQRGAWEVSAESS